MRPVAGCWYAVAVAVIFVAGCASIPKVPTQNILMFSGDGRPVDPTGNLNCAQAASEKGPLCHETEVTDRTVTHVGSLNYTELDNTYFDATYLTGLFACMDEYFDLPPKDPQAKRCKQEPELKSPATHPRAKQILIFVHGGLNTQVDSIQRVVSHTKAQEELYNRIASAGHYPIFINWRASFTSNYFDGLVSIRQGEKKPWLGWSTALPQFFVDVARSIARAPLVWAEQVLNDLKTTPLVSIVESKDPEKVAVELICAYQYDGWDDCGNKFGSEFGKSPPCFGRSDKPDFSGHEKLNEKTLGISVGEDLRSCLKMSVSFIGYFVTLPSRLLVEPVVDAFGTSAWDTMLRRVRLLYNIDQEFGDEASELVRWYASYDARPVGRANIPRSGGVSIFLRRLADKIKDAQKKEPGSEWAITLIGHSMGTIIVNQMLRESLELRLDLPITNIVYMAAAASVRDVVDSVVPYLQNNPHTHFYQLMLHHTADEREPYWQPFGLPIDPTPRGSLLVLIDNFLSKPLTHLDRTAGRFDNFMPAVHNIPPELWPRVRMKVFSVGDSEDVRATDPQRHSDFTTRFKFWIPYCWEPALKMKKEGREPRDCIYDPSE